MSYWAERRTPTMDEAVLARIPDDVPRWKIAYWEFQYALTTQMIIPWLRDRGVLPESGRLLEVGAGEGGCLTALHRATGLPGDGVELSESRTRTARALAEATGESALTFCAGDVTDREALGELSPPYSLILLRDVIEHIERRDVALQHISELLSPDGVVVVSFPPYYSPFGAHQQILRPGWLRLPWIQLLPFFPWLVERGEKREGVGAEIASIRRCSLTIRAFERTVAEGPLRVVERRPYLLRPAFRFRYGMKPVSAGVFGRLPGVRELLTTGVWYLLRK